MRETNACLTAGAQRGPGSPATSHRTGAPAWEPRVVSGVWVSPRGRGRTASHGRVTLGQESLSEQAHIQARLSHQAGWLPTHGVTLTSRHHEAHVLHSEHRKLLLRVHPDDPVGEPVHGKDAAAGRLVAVVRGPVKQCASQKPDVHTRKLPCSPVWFCACPGARVLATDVNVHEFYPPQDYRRLYKHPWSMRTRAVSLTTCPVQSPP